MLAAILGVLTNIFSKIKYLYGVADADRSEITTDSYLAQIMAVDGAAADFDDNTDSLEAIRDRIDALIGTPAADVSADIAALETPNNKALSLGNMRGQLGLNEWFFNIANAAVPNTAIWAVTEDNDAEVKAFIQVADSYMQIKAGTVATNDAIISTKDLMTWSVLKDNGNIASLHLKTKFRVIDLTGEAGFGFTTQSSDGAADVWDVLNFHVASVHIDNDTVNLCSSDGVATEKTDAHTPTWIDTDNTWYTVEIVITTTDVKFYIDEILRATHTTRVPSHSHMAAASAKNTNGITANIDAQYIQVWTE